MKNIFHKITALSMALLVLLTTTSFSVQSHFCGDELVDLALFEEATSCSMQDTDPQMHDLMKDMGCCNDKQIVSEAQQDLQKSTADLSFEQQVFLVAFAHSYEGRFDRSSTATTLILQEKAPSQRRPLFLLHDSFLI